MITATCDSCGAVAPGLVLEGASTGPGPSGDTLVVIRSFAAMNWHVRINRAGPLGGGGAVQLACSERCKVRLGELEGGPPPAPPQRFKC